MNQYLSRACKNINGHISSDFFSVFNQVNFEFRLNNENDLYVRERAFKEQLKFIRFQVEP